VLPTNITAERVLNVTAFCGSALYAHLNPPFALVLSNPRFVGHCITHDRFPELSNGVGHFGNDKTGAAPAGPPGILDPIPITHLLRKKPKEIAMDNSRNAIP
jgi:hypothetical protein